MSVPARVLLVAVRVYQAFFSALMPSACKFYPSCSHYAAEALRIHGALRGSWLALRRVSHCHPFTRGGVDLVPDADEFHAETDRTTGSGGGRGPSVTPGFFALGAKHPQTEVCATKEVRS